MALRAAHVPLSTGEIEDIGGHLSMRTGDNSGHKYDQLLDTLSLDATTLSKLARMSPQELDKLDLPSKNPILFAKLKAITKIFRYGLQQQSL